jgi:hypothetical protein
VKYHHYSGKDFLVLHSFVLESSFFIIWSVKGSVFVPMGQKERLKQTFVLKGLLFIYF